METFSLKDPFAWEFFVLILSLISVNTTAGQMWNCIIFFFLFFIKKEKMKWNEMRMKPCVE